MTNIADTIVVMDTSSIFRLAEPIVIQPKGSESKYTAVAFSVNHRLGSSDGYEIGLWHEVADELECMARTHRRIEIDGSDVTVAIGGKSYVVGEME